MADRNEFEILLGLSEQLLRNWRRLEKHVQGVADAAANLSGKGNIQKALGITDGKGMSDALKAYRGQLSELKTLLQLSKGGAKLEMATATDRATEAWRQRKFITRFSGSPDKLSQYVQRRFERTDMGKAQTDQLLKDIGRLTTNAVTYGNKALADQFAAIGHTVRLQARELTKQKEDQRKYQDLAVRNDTKGMTRVLAKMATEPPTLRQRTGGVPKGQEGLDVLKQRISEQQRHITRLDFERRTGTGAPVTDKVFETDQKRLKILQDAAKVRKEELDAEKAAAKEAQKRRDRLKSYTDPVQVAERQQIDFARARYRQMQNLEMAHPVGVKNDAARIKLINSVRQTDAGITNDRPGLRDLTSRIALQTQRVAFAESQANLNATHQNKANLDLEREALKILHKRKDELDEILAVERKINQQKRLNNKVEQSPALKREMLQGNAKRSREASRARLMGDGGAELFRTQAALLGNYAVMGAGIGMFAGAAQFIVQLDEAARNLQAILALSDNELQSLMGHLVKASEETKFTAVEITQAATVMGQAGFNRKQLEDSMGDIALLATAVGTTLPQAVDVATSTLGIFNLEAANTGRVADVLVTAINTSKLNLEKLTLGMQYAGNIASQLNVSFEETVAVLAAMANSGIRSGSTLGTGLRQILINLQKPSKGFKSWLSNAGLGLDDIDIKSKGLLNVLRTLTKSGFDLSTATRVWETRAAAAFGAVANNLEKASEQMERFQFAGGAAARANEKQMEALSNQLARLRSVAGSVVAEGAEPIKITFIEIIKLLGDGLSYLKEWGKMLQVIETLAISFATAMVGAKLGRLVTGLLGGRALTKLLQQPRFSTRMMRGLVRLGPLGRPAAAMMGPWGVIGSAAATAGYMGYRYYKRTNSPQAKAETAFSTLTANVKSTFENMDRLSDALMQAKLNEDELRHNRQRLSDFTQELGSKFQHLGVSVNRMEGGFDSVVAELERARKRLQENVVKESQDTVVYDRVREVRADQLAEAPTGLGRAYLESISRLMTYADPNYQVPPQAQEATQRLAQASHYKLGTVPAKEDLDVLRRVFGNDPALMKEAQHTLQQVLTGTLLEGVDPHSQEALTDIMRRLNGLRDALQVYEFSRGRAEEPGKEPEEGTSNAGLKAVDQKITDVNAVETVNRTEQEAIDKNSQAQLLHSFGLEFSDDIAAFSKSVHDFKTNADEIESPLSRYEYVDVNKPVLEKQGRDLVQRMNTRMEQMGIKADAERYFNPLNKDINILTATETSALEDAKPMLVRQSQIEKQNAQESIRYLRVVRGNAQSTEEVESVTKDLVRETVELFESEFKARVQKGGFKKDSPEYEQERQAFEEQSMAATARLQEESDAITLKMLEKANRQARLAAAEQMKVSTLTQSNELKYLSAMRDDATTYDEVFDYTEKMVEIASKLPIEKAKQKAKAMGIDEDSARYDALIEQAEQQAEHEVRMIRQKVHDLLSTIEGKLTQAEREALASDLAHNKDNYVMQERLLKKGRDHARDSFEAEDYTRRLLENLELKIQAGMEQEAHKLKINEKDNPERWAQLEANWKQRKENEKAILEEEGRLARETVVNRNSKADNKELERQLKFVEDDYERRIKILKQLRSSADTVEKVRDYTKQIIETVLAMTLANAKRDAAKLGIPTGHEEDKQTPKQATQYQGIIENAREEAKDEAEFQTNVENKLVDKIEKGNARKSKSEALFQLSAQMREVNRRISFDSELQTQSGSISEAREVEKRILAENKKLVELRKQYALKRGVSAEKVEETAEMELATRNERTRLKTRNVIAKYQAISTVNNDQVTDLSGLVSRTEQRHVTSALRKRSQAVGKQVKLLERENQVIERNTNLQAERYNTEIERTQIRASDTGLQRTTQYQSSLVLRDLQGKQIEERRQGLIQSTDKLREIRTKELRELELVQKRLESVKDRPESEVYVELSQQVDSLKGQLQQNEDALLRNTTSMEDLDRQDEARTREFRRVQVERDYGPYTYKSETHRKRRADLFGGQYQTNAGNYEQGGPSGQVLNNFGGKLGEELRYAYEGYDALIELSLRSMSLIQSAENGMASALAKVAKNADDASEAWKDFAQSFLATMTDLAAEMATRQLITTLVQMGVSYFGSSTQFSEANPGATTDYNAPGAPDYSGASGSYGHVQANTGGEITSMGTVRRYAQGGDVPGTVPRDSVPAILRPGEFVLNADSAKAIGYDKLHLLNNVHEVLRMRNESAKERNAAPTTPTLSQLLNPDEPILYPAVQASMRRFSEGGKVPLKAKVDSKKTAPMTKPENKRRPMKRYASGGEVSLSGPARRVVKSLTSSTEINTSVKRALNDETVRTLSEVTQSSQEVAGQAAKGNVTNIIEQAAGTEDKVKRDINIWLVDERTQSGANFRPEDVLAVISDDVVRRGRTRTLIKKVAKDEL